MVWYGMVWYGMVWYGMVELCFIKEILNSAVNKITRKKGMKILCGLNIFRSVSFWRFGVLIYKYFYANIPSRGINYENRAY